MSAKPRRRFTEHRPPGAPDVLALDHYAVAGATTRYRKTVTWPGLAGDVLKSGQHNRKIGGDVVKGPWRGFAVYTLTLEERATCPRECLNWRNCYGNKMPFADRHMHGDGLEARLEVELRRLAMRHPDGFVVRLHVLGDFYSVAYVERWRSWLAAIPQLHVFGYTARDAAGEIGAAIVGVRSTFGRRFSVRFSNQGHHTMGAETVEFTPLLGAAGQPEELRGRITLPGGRTGIVCPAQTGDSDCCGTCGLCWTTSDNVVFLTH